ncbi:MAG: hypothetical protein AB1696_23615 [Planctomycetota bacterium]
MRHCGYLVAVLCGTFLFWFNLYWAAKWWGLTGVLGGIVLSPLHVLAAPILHFMIRGVEVASFVVAGVWALALLGILLEKKSEDP